MLEADVNFTLDVFYGSYLNMKLAIPRDKDWPDFSKVMKCFRYKDGMPMNRAHNIPILDTRMYEVWYKDGQKSLLAANVIAENIFDQVNVEGNQHVLFHDIVDHRYDVPEVN